MKVIISGASRGIGKATAIKLAKEGYNLLLISRDLSSLEDLKNEIKEKYAVEVDIFSADLSKENSLDNLKIKTAEKEKLILINNVGTYANDNASSLNKKEIEQLLETNLYGSIRLTELALPFLRKAKGSMIINIASINALKADLNATAYSISKHALKAWNDALREELRKENIKVTALFPGPVNTSSWEGMDMNQAAMIQSTDIASLIYTISCLSESALVEEILITPLNFKLN